LGKNIRSRGKLKMRASGKTFRVLLEAILTVSSKDETSEKKGLVFYAYNYDYASNLFRKTIDMMMAYGNFPKGIARYNSLEILFPNNKTLQFRSMMESPDRSIGIDWSLYDEVSDHYIPPHENNYERYIEAKSLREVGRKRVKKEQTIIDAKKAVIEANGKIEDILNALFTEYKVITKGMDLHKVNTIRGNYQVIVQLEVTI
jgi:hypothetical protein